MKLERPVKEHLSDRVDRLAIERGLRAVMDRRDRERLQGRVPRGPVAAALMAVAAVAIVVGLILGHQSSTPRATAPGPLALRGAAVATLETEASRAEALSDGSRIELGAGARLEVLENTGSAFTTRLARGRVTCDVVPGGPRRWTIETPLATVEVVGTKFTVERTDAGVRVEVERGVVLVRGERVPERVQRLGAGQSLDIPADAPTPPAPPPPASGATSSSSSAAPPPPAPPASASATPERPWEPLAKRGNYKEAWGELGEGGIRTETARAATAAELLTLADVARLSGHPREAVAPLQKAAATPGGGSQSAIAAFTLGRVQLDDLGDAARAAEAFDRAVALGLPDSLLEDALARRVEARARAGDEAGATRARADYVARFPDGRSRAKVDGWSRDR